MKLARLFTKKVGDQMSLTQGLHMRFSDCARSSSHRLTRANSYIFRNFARWLLDTSIIKH